MKISMYIINIWSKEKRCVMCIEKEEIKLSKSIVFLLLLGYEFIDVRTLTSHFKYSNTYTVVTCIHSLTASTTYIHTFKELNDRRILTHTRGFR